MQQRLSQGSSQYLCWYSHSAELVPKFAGPGLDILATSGTIVPNDVEHTMIVGGHSANLKLIKVNLYTRTTDIFLDSETESQLCLIVSMVRECDLV